MLGALTALLASLQKIPDDERPGIEAEPETAPELAVRRVGAWAGSASMASPKAIREAVNFSKSIGLTRLDIICNDDSEERKPIKFSTFDKERIIGLALDAAAAGIETHLMTWCMPHKDYLTGMRDQMLDLMERTGAASIELDAEEPWTQADFAMRYDEAAKLVRELFGDTRIGVNAIGYASKSEVGPLLRIADSVMPQCYSTSTSGLDPSTVVPRLVGHWRKTFGIPSTTEWCVGLAAYRQSGIKGYTVESAMRSAFGGALADPTLIDVVYWSLAQIRSHKTVAKTITTLAKSTGMATASVA